MPKLVKDTLEGECAPIRKEKDILENIIDCVKNIHLVYLDRNFNFVRVNQAYAKTCGYTPEQMIGKNHFALYPNAENEAIFRKVRDTGVPAQFRDKPFTFPDQHQRGVTYWDWSLEPIKDDSGKVEGLVFSLVETTERKKAEEALQKAKEQTELDWKRLENILETSPSAVVILEAPDCKFSFANRRALQLYGFDTLGLDLAENVAKIKAKRTDGSDYPIEKMPVSRSLRFGEEVRNEEMIIERPDGTAFPIIASTAPLRDTHGNITAAIVVFEDITERKRAEEASIKSEKEYRSLFENMVNGFAYCQMIFDEDGKPIDFIYLEINDAFERITGLNRQQVIGKKITEAIPGTEKSNPEIFEIYGRVASTCQKEKFEIFFKPLKLWLLISVYCPKIGYFAAIFEDITESKQAQEKLKEHSEQLQKLVRERTEKLSVAAAYARSLIEASLDPLVTINPEGKITDVNSATEANTGCSREELIGSDFSNYFTEPEKARAGYMKAFTDGFVRDYPLAIKHKSGKVTEVLYNATVYTNEAGEMQGVFAAARDISALKRAEELAEERRKKLKGAERLAAIGATAGMVGHDVRNPLQAITSDLYLLKGELSSMPECKTKAEVSESLEGIEKNIDYINKIVADLQDYARAIAPAVQEVDLVALCDGVLFKNGVPKNVRITCAIEDEVRVINSDKDLLKRILSNLTSNAVQAMPNGGSLTINACKQQGDIVITVEDTGVGIPEEVKDKLFTPMFTTKSKGQGFGLAVVKRMTEALGGSVNYESKVGKGTKFIIRFPPQRDKR